MLFVVVVVSLIAYVFIYGELRFLKWGSASSEHTDVIALDKEANVVTLTGLTQHTIQGVPHLLEL